MRSERAKEPTLIWPTCQPTARCRIAVSSLSPERAEAMPPKPTSRAARQAARASLTVPRWFGLISRQLAAPEAAAARTLSTLVTRKSSPTTCTRPPAARVKAAKPAGSSSPSGSSSETMG